MVEFIDNIYVELGGRVYQQTVGIPMGTVCVPLVEGLFLHSYEADFVQHLRTRVQERKQNSMQFNLCYINDVPSLN